MKYFVIKDLILPKILNLLQWFIIFLLKENSGGTVKNQMIFIKEIEELHKPVIK